eukprot:860152-Pleurochrysis_carterae.AAC.1
MPVLYLNATGTGLGRGVTQCEVGIHGRDKRDVGTASAVRGQRQGRPAAAATRHLRANLQQADRGRDDGSR